jgi:hypothetical protein
MAVAEHAGVISLVAAGGGLALGVAGTVLPRGRSSDFNDHCTVDMGVPTATHPVPGTTAAGNTIPSTRRRA